MFTHPIAARTNTPEDDRNIAFYGSRLSFAGRSVVLENESTERYQELVDSYLIQFRPQGAIEALLVDQIVAAQWRLQRIRRAEAAAEYWQTRRQKAEAGQSADIPPFCEPLCSSRFRADLRRQKASLTRSYHDSRKCLLEIQNERNNSR
jgi:hypothetical protein